MVLTPDTKANPLGTHADAGATGAAPWPATGYNQANDIMQPFLPPGTSRTLSATDFSVLADAFGWNRTGIRIFINNIGGTMDDTDLNILANAAAAITAQYGSFGNSPSFTWNVAEVAPEPSTWLTGFLGGAFLIAVVRRRAAS